MDGCNQRIGGSSLISFLDPLFMPWDGHGVPKMYQVKGNCGLPIASKSFFILSPCRPEWGGALHAFTPKLHHVGIESLSLDFALRRYNGHHLEHGYNGIFFR